MGFPVSSDNPAFAFVWVSPFRPPPQHFPYTVVYRAEASFGACGMMVIRPSDYDFIQSANQCFLRRRPVILNHSADFLRDSAHGFVGRLDNQLSFEFAEVPSQKIKPIIDVGNNCFLRR